MKVYEGANIRNVAVIGHGHAGKTSLVSAMLYAAGANQRLGRVDDGTSTTDYDEEEIGRKMSISASLAHVEWGKTKINIVDTPGFNMFVHEAKLVLPVVDAAVVVPSDDYGWVETAHVALHHALTYAVRDRVVDGRSRNVPDTAPLGGIAGD